MIPAINGVMLAISSSLAASVVAKVTTITALALFASRLARESRAAVRHALLAAAFGVTLLLPIASVLVPPVHIGVPVGVESRAAVPTVIDVMPSVAPVDSGARVAIPQASRFSLTNLLLAGWIVGIALFLLPMVIGLWQIRSLRRSGLPWRHGQSVAEALALDAGIKRRIEVLLHEALSGPMTCGVAHPAIVLPRDAENWCREDLNRAIVHELEHVRRGDSVSRCLARAACSVYWFHPLVWIAWRKLVLEAERSCDDAVLRHSEAADYADQLVGLAKRLSVAQRLPLLAMASRADLATRVGAVLDSRQRRGRAGTIIVVIACAGAFVLVVAMSPLRLVAAPQAASATTTKASEFDAVSVKLVDPNVQGEHSHSKSDPGRLTMTGTMHRFIVQAFGITDAQLGDEPDWFATRVYSIEAVTSAPANQDQMMLMLRAALADRFQLKLRQESRDVSVFALEVAAGGPKFKALKPGDVQRDENAPEGIYARSFSSVKVLISALNGTFGGIVRLDRTVVDHTRLTGNYDIHLRTEMVNQTDDFGRPTSQLPNLSRDIQAQLGLKLVPQRVSMPYLVVEHAAAPTPN